MSHSPLGCGKAFLASAGFALAASALAACGGSSTGLTELGRSSGQAALPAARQGGASGYTYSTVDNPNDSHYTMLTGINNEDKISGYYGDGAGKHPNRGFIVYEPYGPHNFKTANFPGAFATQVRSLNNKKALAGFFVDATHRSWIFGFTENNGIWTEHKDPKLRGGTSNVTELLGLNDAGLTVGFYTDDSNVNHAFELDQAIGKYHSIIPPGVVSAKATGINGKGDVCGYATVASGATVSWLLKGGSFTLFGFPGSTDTEALGLNWQDQIVGSYVDLSGVTHGFILSNPLNSQNWLTVDQPKASGVTVVTGIEDHRNVVGYYVDHSGNTNGFIGYYGSK